MPNEAKYIFETKHFYYSKTFIEYLNDIEDIDKYIEEYNPNEKLKKYCF